MSQNFRRAFSVWCRRMWWIDPLIRAAAREAVAAFMAAHSMRGDEVADVIDARTGKRMTRMHGDRVTLAHWLMGTHEPYVAGTVDRVLGRRPRLFHRDADPDTAEFYRYGYENRFGDADDLARAARISVIDLNDYSSREQFVAA